MKIEFKEEQKFGQWWIWLLLSSITLIPVYGLYKQIIVGQPFGDNPTSDLGLVIFLIFMLAFLGLFWKLQLKTEIDQKVIRIRFSILAHKNIQWKDVQSAELVDYGFVGGWGVRLSTNYGTVYNTQGSKGLAIVLKSGKKLVVGTQKEQELKQVLSNIKLID